MEEIVTRERENSLKGPQPQPFQKGEALRIMSGALADCIGLFEEMADRGRVIVLLDLLGGRGRVQAPRGPGRRRRLDQPRPTVVISLGGESPRLR